MTTRPRPDFCVRDRGIETGSMLAPISTVIHGIICGCGRFHDNPYRPRRTSHGDLSLQLASTDDVWSAVGVLDTACPEPLSDSPPNPVNITEPLDGSVVSGKRAWLRATAQDDDGITKFEFFLPEFDPVNPICVDSSGSASGSCRWNSNSVPDGVYEVFFVHAWDTAIQSTDSLPITITVANGSDGGGGKWTCEDRPEHKSRK